MVTRIYISPDHPIDQVDLTNFDHRVNVHESRVKKWLFGPAHALLGVSDSWFSVLQLVLSYFEGYEILRRGQDSIGGHSQEFFRSAFLDVFQDTITCTLTVAQPSGVVPVPLSTISTMMGASASCSTTW